MARIRKLNGKRIYLSPLNPEDAPHYARWLNDQEVVKTLPIASKVITEEGEREYLKNSILHSYGIVLDGEERLIGNCGYVVSDPLHATAEIGVFIGEKEAWGFGYGREAMSLLIEYGFRVLNLHNIMLRCLAFNPRGLSSYRSLSFREMGRQREAHRYDGVWHDLVYMDLLPQDFIPFDVRDS